MTDTALSAVLKSLTGARFRARACDPNRLQAVRRVFGPICLWLEALGLRLPTRTPT